MDCIIVFFTKSASSLVREWLIDDDKQVLSDWVKIRERIDKDVAVSARIESGVMFNSNHFIKYIRV